jgi:hypothetical protein
MLRLALMGVLLCFPAEEFVKIDFGSVDRTIGKEPEYVGDPLYAKFILDAAGKFQVWAVLDRTKADLPYHDVVYFDRNGNGDLTEKGERFLGEVEKQKDGSARVMVEIGEVPVPGGDLVHSDMSIYTAVGRKIEGVPFTMKWAGEERITGGYRSCSRDYTVWGKSAAEAPVLRPAVGGTLSFAISASEELSLPIGEETNVYLRIGNRGSRDDTLCAVSKSFLDLEKDKLTVTVIAKDKNGKEIRHINRIQGSC